VSIFDVETGNLVYTLFEDNEEILSFAVSPNDKYIATTNKTFMTRVYLLASLTSTKVNNQSFRTPNQMVLEVAFCP